MSERPPKKTAPSETAFAGASGFARRFLGQDLLEWIKVVGPLLISWPTVALIAVVLFHSPIVNLISRFTESPGSSAEIGAMKVVLGPAVVPPQYRTSVIEVATERIDLSSTIGRIRDTGPEITSVGFAVAYAVQAELKVKKGAEIQLSPRSIMSAAKVHDDFPGENYEGSSIVGALRGMKIEGAFDEQAWPYSSKTKPSSASSAQYRISGFEELGISGLQAVAAALRDGKVVVATIAVTPDFDNAQRDGKVIIKADLAELGMKAIAIVGYDSQTAEFRFANDWGVNWGESGFGYLRDTDLLRGLRNAYTVTL